MKKYIAILFSAVLFFGLGTGAFAADSSSDTAKAYEMIDKTNAEIADEVEKAVEKSDKLYADYLASVEGLDTNSKEYADLTEKYNKKLDKVVDKVYNKTLEMTAAAIEKAAELGVVAECEWILVRFGDRDVWIDPIRVVPCCY
ncbi:hypothetical protein [Jeotgalibacillus sp. R-1-5s-1]|uniref:hypothetical protein n=1 Tax=Jeotgalibacillus sp. R-1-5s-1 TaxID=2555897 RepID=UPI00106B73B8|nr:hypothetical protein [Jeotgalibacillus sp. R-1-5s-1]TFE00178.1 hypothetical protein E2491_07015 [Jeotgalibacillus sp. R-1-5s-1]